MKQLSLIAALIILGNSAWSQSTDIRLNQIGFYTNCTKIAIVKNAGAVSFYIALPGSTTALFTGTLSVAATWVPSNESVRIADFSAFTTPGEYELVVTGLGRSFPFAIGPRVHLAVNKASIKAFYYQRASTELLAAHAGVWARAAGHPDNSVIILPSAAGPSRVAGNTFASAKGWYDAGDYNKYIVNSGISTYTLLAAYEHYSTYYDTLDLNIPESGNSLPDILDEIKWNLEWMLSAQDPADGGVYNKVTNAGFDGMVMPDAATNARYFCAKGTAATFDFAAVMAAASRIYEPYDAVFAAQCLDASVDAYNWGITNPNVAFNNPGAQAGYPAVTTGGYGDGNYTDEREWAATELYISTLNDTYYANSFKNANTYGVPSWPNVRTLGLMSLVHHRKNLSPIASADSTNMKNKFLAIADPLRTYAQSTAYRVAVTNGDLFWGSNGQAANQGMILLQAYNFTKDITYFTSAISNLDYLNGRNATTYAFVTGHGDKTPMHPHHRPSEGDGITDPVPGFLVGGPNASNQNDCGAASYPTTTLRGLSYVDALCSYSTNEVTINWNAPYAYLSGAIEAVNPCRSSTLPVELISLEVSQKDEGALIRWTTSSELNNDYFILEESSNGENFTFLARIEGKGNSDVISQYQFFDDEISNAFNYYRIVQVDHDGTNYYSHIVSIHFSESGLSIYPNPSTSVVNLEFSGGWEGEISLADITGKNVLKEKVTYSGYITKTYDWGSLPRGVYILVLNSDKEKIVKRITLH